jgi:hypothetical protein
MHWRNKNSFFILEIKEEELMILNRFNGLESLMPLIQSQGGLHFSAYISREVGAPSVKDQLQEALKVASEDIRTVLGRDERKHFLKPLQALLNDTKMISGIKGNLGIFRSPKLFRVLHVPVPVDEYSTVASSFHVKPLLRWVQEDRVFRLLTVSEKMSCLYLGTQHSLRPLDTFVGSKNKPIKTLSSLSEYFSKRKTHKKQEKLLEILGWLEGHLDSESDLSSTPLFVVAPTEARMFLNQSLGAYNIHFLEESNTRALPSAIARIRKLLREDAEFRLREKINDFELAEALEIAESNVARISKAAHSGRVKKLLIAGDMKVFGKIAPDSGNVTFHSTDLDHEDEDILDDIAQAVVKQGGEVVVVPKRKIPGEHPILAITKSDIPLMRSHLWRVGESTAF